MFAYLSPLYDICFLRAGNQPSLLSIAAMQHLQNSTNCVCGGGVREKTLSLILFSEQWRGAKCLRIQGVLIKIVSLLFVLIPRASFKNVSLRFRCSVKVTHICSTSSLVPNSRLETDLSKQAVELT